LCYDDIDRPQGHPTAITGSNIANVELLMATQHGTMAKKEFPDAARHPYIMLDNFVVSYIECNFTLRKFLRFETISQK